MKKIISIVIIVILFTGCNNSTTATYTVENKDGIEVIKNDNIPADPDYKIKMRLSADLNFDEISQKDTSNAVQLNNIELDQYGNMYVLDARKSKIHKFDKYGKRLVTFGERGQGPGEFIGAGFFVVWHDTVYVPFNQQFKILKFDTDGNFITDKRYEDPRDFPRAFWKTRNFVTGISMIPLPEEGEAVFKRNLNLFNDKFNKLKTFMEDRVDFGTNIFDLNLVRNPCVAVSSDSLVYLPRYSYNDYIIDVYDFYGNKRQVIKKKYRKIAFTENEISQFQVFLDRNGLTAKGKFKNSITLISMDKYDRLWVLAAQPESEKRKLYDIFEKGIYINTVEIEADSTDIVDFVENKLVAFDAVNNKMKYYDY
ncbi:MAG: 6-bladed beta-propeller [Candidatus Delongbacteria bacterium]|nr:6-bladed beta-propeller [Candidatus Delongbacteria bacterium]